MLVVGVKVKEAGSARSFFGPRMLSPFAKAGEIGTVQADSFVSPARATPSASHSAEDCFTIQASPSSPLIP